MTVEIVTREAWRAVPTKKVWLLSYPVIYVFLKLTNEGEFSVNNQSWLRPLEDNTTSSCCMEMRFIQRGDTVVHFQMPDIRFSFMIGRDGKAYEGRGWKEAPTLPKRYSTINRRSLYIGLVGNFSEIPASAEMFYTIEKLLHHGIDQGFVSKRFTEFYV